MHVWKVLFLANDHRLAVTGAAGSIEQAIKGAWLALGHLEFESIELISVDRGDLLFFVYSEDDEIEYRTDELNPMWLELATKVEELKEAGPATLGQKT